jgi:glycosyltransferase involved in cell wall biosynthesis
LDYFAPDPKIPREENLIVISGKMSYHANVAMALYLVNEIMPLVWESKPEARVAIVGKDPPAMIRNLAEDPRVEVTGMVPDLRDYLRRATMAAAPIRYGVGIQNKVLEAMACGTPVVATKGIISGIHAQPGKDLMVAEDASSFADRVIELLNHPHQCERLGMAGRKFVETHHHWENICRKLTQIYSEAGAKARHQVQAK